MGCVRALWRSRARRRPPILATLAIIAMLPVVATMQQVGGITTAGGAVATIAACVVLLLSYSELVNWAGSLAADLLMAGFDATIDDPAVSEGLEAAAREEDRARHAA